MIISMPLLRDMSEDGGYEGGGGGGARTSILYILLFCQ